MTMSNRSKLRTMYVRRYYVFCRHKAARDKYAIVLRRATLWLRDYVLGSGYARAMVSEVYRNQRLVIEVKSEELWCVLSDDHCQLPRIGIILTSTHCSTGMLCVSS